MKKAKKLVCLLLTIVMVCTLAVGCGKDSDKQAKYEKGTLTENSFSSKFLGLQFDVPEGYTMFTQEQLDQNIQAATELMYKDDSEKVIDYAKLNLVYEMMCADSTLGMPNVNIVVENIAGKGISEDQYIDITKKNLENTGFNYTYDDVDKDADFVGQKYNLLKAKLSANGIDMVQDIYYKKIGTRMVCITVTYSEDLKDAKDDLVGAFKEIK